MHIGIDARLIDETGVGRYIRNLIKNLTILDTKNTYSVFLRKKSFDAFKVPNTQWKKVLAEVPWHTVREQMVMPYIFYKAHLDVVHIPYHNPPIFYPGVMIITIHDLIILHFNTGKATTLPKFLYSLKRFGYWLELAIGLFRAKKIIAVSQSTKKEIIDHFRVPEKKIVVTYEGVDETLRNKSIDKKLIQDAYFLYVGNAYPHKNLETLLKAFTQSNLKLVLVGRQDYFYSRLKENVKDNNIIFFGQANDEQLRNLYSHAQALIFPSFMEGFGLPGIEALTHGCPVLCSDIPVFHEIFGDYAVYFDPHNHEDMKEKIMHIQDIKKPDAKYFMNFDWKKLSMTTQSIYESSSRL